DSYSETLRNADVVVISDKDEPGRKHAAEVAESLQAKAKRVRTIELSDFNGKKVKDAHDYFSAGAQAEDLIAEVDKCKTLLDRIRERRFNIHVKPKPAEPRYSINGIPVCTPGNLAAIAALVKVGKTATINAAISSTMGKGDNLGWTSSNPEGNAVLK